jgi:hypothetical protein
VNEKESHENFKKLIDKNKKDLIKTIEYKEEILNLEKKKEKVKEENVKEKEENKLKIKNLEDKLKILKGRYKALKNSEKENEMIKEIERLVKKVTNEKEIKTKFKDDIGILNENVKNGTKEIIDDLDRRIKENIENINFPKTKMKTTLRKEADEINPPGGQLKQRKSETKTNLVDFNQPNSEDFIKNCQFYHNGKLQRLVDL